ncbi:hypothetical protein DV20_01280 [Amycolatopsis rifamycinica]|uniref:HD domain-containing protein n=2 Tax=Amycolatopsis rifamycinica TaxID=287986 RepID=A0A066U9A3_9PSEU|nr:hypothetical protein DV20_01280 [Amycolatopsis rifamycinica]
MALAIARRLNRTDGFDLDIPAIEAAALAHDIGHPPFGHVAERQLDTLTSSDGGFESNAQAVHVLLGDHITLRKATIAALVKYATPIPRYDPFRTTVVKGIYQADFPRLSATLPRAADRGPEWQVVDIADDFSNAIFDIHDLVHFHGSSSTADVMHTLLPPAEVSDHPLTRDAREAVEETLSDLYSTLIPGMLSPAGSLERVRLRDYVDSWISQVRIVTDENSSTRTVSVPSPIKKKITVLQAVVAIAFLETEINRKFDHYIEHSICDAFNILRRSPASRIDDLATWCAIPAPGPLGEPRAVLNFLHQMTDVQLLAVAESTTAGQINYFT